MKRILVVFAVVAAIALISAGAAMAGISATKHNLTSTGTGSIKASAGQQGDQICIWCHTPHAANTAFIGAPLWNKATPTGTYTMYGTTIAGDTTAAQPAASSLACLSCHDGVNAINSLVLQSDGTYNAGGYNVAFGTTPAGTALVMPVGGTDLTQNLKTTHPVSITYTPGVAGLYPVATALTGSWIVSGTAQISSLLRGGAVECASCHEPHTSVNTMFLRTSNSGSALCLGCHNM